MLQPMMHHVHARWRATCSEPVHKHIPTFLLPHATGAQISSSPVRTSKAAASRTRCIVREHRNQDWRRKKRRTTQQHGIVSPSSFHRDLCIMQFHPLAVLINPRRHPRKKKPTWFVNMVVILLTTNNKLISQSQVNIVKPLKPGLTKRRVLPGSLFVDSSGRIVRIVTKRNPSISKTRYHMVELATLNPLKTFLVYQSIKVLLIQIILKAPARCTTCTTTIKNRQRCTYSPSFPKSKKMCTQHFLL